MLNNYKILTITHKRISLKDIGNFVVNVEDNSSMQERLEEIKAQFNLSELMYSNTCNRVLFFFATEEHIDSHFISEFFKAINPSASEEWLSRIPEIARYYQGMDAMRHFFNVAASIDSLVIGERQILGQLKESFDHCNKWGLIGDSIRLAMNKAIVSAKAVYSNTQIGDKAVSVVSLATQKLLATNVKKNDRILIIGAGQTNQLVAKFLAKHDFENITVFNRSVEKARQLADTVDGNALPLSLLKEYKSGFDCLIVCTASKKPIITADLYNQLLNGETNKKLIIDLAVPHNVSEEVLNGFAVNYIEIEGLRNLANENLAAREREVVHAKAILEDHLDEFPILFKQRQLEVAMRQVPTKIKEVRKKAMNEVFKKEIETLDEPTKELVDKMLAYMEKKCIGIPMKAAREMLL